MTTRYENVIFDLDGTLIDSAADISDCLRKAFFETTGKNTVCGIDRVFLGSPLSEIVSAVAPELSATEAASVCAKFRELYDSSGYPLTVLMPGVRDAVLVLLRANIRLFIATNKPIKPTLRILARLGITEWFRDAVSPDVLPGQRMSKPQMLDFLIKKWAMERRATLMVGDSETDIAAAKQNHIPCAYLTSGYGDDSRAASLKPEILRAGMEFLLTI